MNNAPSNSKQSPNPIEDLMESVAKDIKDPKRAELMTEIVKAASNGNKELADILSRMIKAELDSIRTSAT